MANRLTGTGLDRLVKIIESDPGLDRRLSDAEIDKGAQAAGELNHMILDGIREMGLANDGTIDAADLRSLGQWVQSDSGRNQTFRELYGTNRKGVETGFQLVEQEDSSTRLFGEDAVDEVADGIYSFGFGSVKGRLLDVDGNLYRSLNLTSSWLDRLLTDEDMAALSNPAAEVTGTTGTGLDHLVDAVLTDPGLVRNISQSDIDAGALAVDALNHMYLDGIREMGLYNDGVIDRSDIQAIDSWVRADAGRHAEFLELHEGYHLIYNKGADLSVLNIEGMDGMDHSGHMIDDGITPHKGHVINHAMNGIYHIGFGVEKGRLINDAGDPDISTRVPAEWFDQLLTQHDQMVLNNTEGTALAKGTTGTGLDKLVDIILDDAGLARNVSRADIAEAARAADGMNNILVDTIKKLGVANDGRINDVDVEKISKHIRANDALHDEFLMLRGQQSGPNGETGFHMVQGNGGTTKIFDKFAVNNVADAVYHVGFEYERNMFLDDDGDRSYSVVRVAEWIDELYFA